MRTFSSVALVVSLVACSSDPQAPSNTGLVDPAIVARGDYLARSVAGCGECHTPRDAAGNLDMSMWMAGVADRFDLVPEDPNVGQIPAPNLTPDPTGLGAMPEAQIIRAIRDGIGPGNRVMTPLMPSYVFHNMTDEDAHAIAIYLKTLRPIDNKLPTRQPLPIPLDKPASPVPESAIPHTTLPSSNPQSVRAEHGRYLAAEVGFCMDCHTHWVLGRDQPLDLDALFAGNRALSARDWTVPPPARRVIYSTNLTPHKSGLDKWSPQDVQVAIKTGIDRSQTQLCRPMPSGPFGAFGGLTDSDTLDIGLYLTSLPPIDSGDIPSCQ